MTIYRVQGPDGKVHRFEGPEGVPPEQVEAFAAQMFKKAPTWEEKVAAERGKMDSTEGMSLLEKLLAGAGKSFTDIGRGVGQIAGQTSQAEIDQAKASDKDLMATGGGLAGNILGNVAMLAPTAMIPGANAVTGAGTIGAISGAIQPVASDESRLRNTLLGAGFSAALPAGVAGYKMIRAATDPFHGKGQDRILSETLKRFGADSEEVAALLKNPEILVPGTRPTVAEVAGAKAPGLAVLQRSAASSDPQIAGAFATREAENAAARIGAVKEIAGDAGKIDYYRAARDAEAKNLYAKAFEQQIEDTPWLKGQFTQLMKRPAFVQSLKEGQELAMNEGVAWAKGAAKKGEIDPSEAVKIMHYTKMSIDDKISAAAASGNKNEVRSLMSVRDKLLETLESNKAAPAYREARDTYAQMSKPINQMEVGEALYNKMQPALSDFAGDAAAMPRVRSEAFANALRNGDETAKRATGFSGATMESIMSPEQMASLGGVAKDLARRAGAQEIGKVSGSPTAQYLSSQNLMRQVAGPLGVPQSWVESALAQTAARPMDFMAKRAEPVIQQKLAEALLNPQEAARLLSSMSSGDQSVLAKLLGRYLPVSTGAALTSESK